MKNEIKEKLINNPPKEKVVQEDKTKEMQYKLANIFFDMWLESINNKKDLQKKIKV